MFWMDFTGDVSLTKKKNEMISYQKHDPNFQYMALSA